MTLYISCSPAPHLFVIPHTAGARKIAYAFRRKYDDVPFEGTKRKFSVLESKTAFNYLPVELRRIQPLPEPLSLSSSTITIFPTITKLGYLIYRFILPENAIKFSLLSDGREFSSKLADRSRIC